MPRHSLLRTTAAVLGATLAACAKTEKPADQAAAPPAAPAPAPVVHVTATDYAFDAPDSLPAGITTFHLMDSGKEPHHLVLVKMSMADLQKMNPNAPPPADLVMSGGANAAMPGGTAEATVELLPGEYTMVCMIPSPDGKPHMMKGMMHALKVTPAAGATAAMPTPDITVKLVDYDFQFSAPLTAGRHVVRIENAAEQVHEMVMVKLEPGKTAEDFAKWSEKPNGPPPGALVNGGAPMTKGIANTVVMDLAPGNYGLMCFVADAKDGKLHLVHGMIKNITIS